MMFVFKRILTISNRNCSRLNNWRHLAAQSSSPTPENETSTEPKKTPLQLSEYRFIYPEFLPDPKYEFRNKVREKLEREDMLRRRKVIEIPEFYVGSIMAVTASDPHAPSKENRFVGICIGRTYAALRATFTLRNVVDGQGIEVMYDLYNPTLLSIEVLRLEKRLDDELYYLRDAPPEYSTFPFDMEPEFVLDGQAVPLNTLKVPLKPPPWSVKWEQRCMKGLDDSYKALIPRNRRLRLPSVLKPYEAYDIMKQYRTHIPEEDQAEIWEEVSQHIKPKKQQLWKKVLQKAKPKRKS